MSFINKKNLFIGVAAFLVGTFAVASFFGFSLMQRQSTVSGKITNVLLDREGRTNGMILDSGLQINFSPETGGAVFAVAKIGDEISATGDAGKKTDYGQAFHAKQLTVNGQTFTEIGAPKPPKGDKPRPPKPPKGDKPIPPAPNAEIPPADANALKPNDAENTPAPPKPAGDVMNANGTIQKFLVTMRGDIDGVVLSGGEQVRFSPKVGEQIISNKIAADSPTAVEGPGMKTERGTILQAAKMTIGSQTFTIND